MVRAFPAPFRAAYGDEVVDLFAARVADARRCDGWCGVIEMWAREFVDLARAVVTSRFHWAIDRSREPPANTTRHTEVRAHTLVVKER